MRRSATTKRVAVLAIAGSGAFVAGVYAGYPAWLYARSRRSPRPLRLHAEPPTRVSVIIAAHDEEASIGDKLDDLAGQVLAGMASELEVVVASDGSTDRTVALASAHPSDPIVLDLPRGGKAHALNRAIAASTGEVLVFTDANSRLDPSALAELLTPLRDPSVGGVAGDQRYGERSSGAATGERTYWSLERTLKEWQSEAGCVISSTGALHAVRRRHVQTVPPDVTDDFYLSTGVIADGARLVFAPRAAAWEEPNDDSRAEYRRRVRIVTRGLTGVRRRHELLNPRRYGSYAAMLLIQKVARRLVFVPMVVTFVASLVLRPTHRIWQLAVAGQLAFYGVALVGASAPTSVLGQKKAVALPAHFCVANIASADAVWRVVRGHRFEVWEPERVD